MLVETGFGLGGPGMECWWRLALGWTVQGWNAGGDWLWVGRSRDGMLVETGFGLSGSGTECWWRLALGLTVQGWNVGGDSLRV